MEISGNESGGAKGLASGRSVRGLRLASLDFIIKVQYVKRGKSGDPTGKELGNRSR